MSVEGPSANKNSTTRSPPKSFLALIRSACTYDHARQLFKAYITRNCQFPLGCKATSCPLKRGVFSRHLIGVATTHARSAVLSSSGQCIIVATTTTTCPVSAIIPQKLTFVMEGSQGMAPPPRGVLHGLIKDWGKGSSKILLELGEERGGQWRQFVLENMTSWHSILEFGERGRRALLQASSNTESRRREWLGERTGISTFYSKRGWEGKMKRY